MTDTDRRPRGDSPIGTALDRIWDPHDPYDPPIPAQALSRGTTEDGVPLFADAARFAANGLTELAANPLITAIAHHHVGLLLTPAEISAAVAFLAALEAPRTSAQRVTA